MYRSACLETVPSYPQFYPPTSADVSTPKWCMLHPTVEHSDNLHEISKNIFHFKIMVCCAIGSLQSYVQGQKRSRETWKGGDRIWCLPLLPDWPHLPHPWFLLPPLPEISPNPHSFSHPCYQPPLQLMSPWQMEASLPVSAQVAWSCLPVVPHDTVRGFPLGSC